MEEHAQTYEQKRLYPLPVSHGLYGKQEESGHDAGTNLRDFVKLVDETQIEHDGQEPHIGQIFPERLELEHHTEESVKHEDDVHIIGQTAKYFGYKEIGILYGAGDTVVIVMMESILIVHRIGIDTHFTQTCNKNEDNGEEPIGIPLCTLLETVLQERQRNNDCKYDEDYCSHFSVLLFF